MVEIILCNQSMHTKWTCHYIVLSLILISEFLKNIFVKPWQQVSIIKLGGLYAARFGI